MTTGEDRPVAVVTGAGRGLGRAYALRLARLGYHVAVADRDLHSYREVQGEHMTADSTVEEIKALGVDAFGFEVDAADFETMADLAQQVQQRWGHIDVAVCNAGGGSTDLSGGLASTLTASGLHDVVGRNLTSTVATCVAVAPMMQKQGAGSIVTVSSQAGILAQRDGGYADYGLAKAAVASYTRYLAQDLGPHGVRVNCIAPGFIDTARVGAGMRRQGIDTFGEQTALRRVGTVDDCAGVLEFLVSPLSQYVTGQVVCVDGGLVRGPS